ncbi:hypothetical protein AMS68_000965 [Peltaster fructicola]|uniref:BAG domain-containing protein n=1 Tax=Peltaster fructicola TaxID=286661 RepID=A0A6H0XLE5_9PEZI|nr:hypothetical protein AMS68_000965 [Peltaster fructicola]
MSWLRFNNLSRLSPFTRTQGSSTVSDADFSYITNEDLQRHAKQTEAEQTDAGQASSPDLGQERDTDVITLRDKRNEYSVHFPAYSIAQGELRIKAVREAAARKLNVDPGKVKLLHKGRNLKDDRLQARAEGLRSGSELLCSIDDPNYLSDLDDSEDGGSELTKKQRNRNNRNRKKKTRADGDESLGVPPAQSRGPSPGASTGTSTPLTAKDKLNALRATLQSYDQDVQAFLRHPPADPAKRDFERKRLSETLLTQVLLKTDAIESEGDPTARTNRKELVKDVQDVLKSLDEAHGGQT